MASTRTRLRALPSVESLLQQPDVAGALKRLPRMLVVEVVRAELIAMRARLQQGGGSAPDAAALARQVVARAEAEARPALRRVLNATGVVLHTNLGRAPLADSARHALIEVARGYSSLELDLSTGKRGDRGVGIERWLRRLTNADAALAVNNGAAAVMLVIGALGAGRKVLVSRGELVEIGGSFRIPEILEKSGATLLEIGTTNRTHLADYKRALERHRDAGAILRVHRSNFRLEGFTVRPPIEDLAELARRRRIPLIEDLGSGALTDLSAFGLEKEPTVAESLEAGCDVVTFSGDKLLGASQAGLIVGRKRYVERVRRDPLTRALRLDKLSLAALESTLALYADPARAAQEVPVLGMLAASPETLERRARTLAEAIGARVPDLAVTVEPGQGEVGGGSLPLQKLPGWVVALAREGMGAEALERWARSAEPPVIGYVRAGKLRLDVRTIAPEEVADLVDALAGTPLPR